MSCLSPELALEFVAGALPKTPAREVESHMARCGECRRLIVEIVKSNEAPDTDVDARSEPLELVAVANQTTAAGSRRAAEGRPHDSAATTLQLTRGTRIQRYTLLYQLGEGGMGSVHAAFDPRLDRRVALKFLRTDLIGSPKKEHRERLVREARALARLSHANVVSIFDVAETDGSVFLAMELIDGSNARIWRELGSRSIAEIVKIYRDSLSALIAAHDQGIIHRDFKPDNVMVGADGVARVTDFGLARAAMVDVDELLAEASSKGVNWETLTQTGLVLGTPRYMAPEQFSGVANESTDQFSFCLSLYEALYGHYPLGTKTPRNLEPNRDISEQILAPLNKGKVPDNLRRILLRGMAVNPRERWPSLRELQYELSLVLLPNQSGLRWAALAGITALVAGAAFFFAPDPPPAIVHDDVAGYSAELEELRRQMDKRRVVDEELLESQKQNRELTRLLRDRERELAVAQLAEEAKQALEENKRRRTSAPRPLPIRSVERSVTTRLSEVLACYEDSITDEEEQLVKVKVGIASTGIVKWVAPPLFGNPRASRCLERALEKITLPASDGATTATLHLSFFRLDSGLLAVNMRAKTRHASLGQVTIDSKGRVLVDCSATDPLCGL